ncbi:MULTISPECIES: WecB/TagA/CpsF family glycosyltransferase [Meridianimaribacter]|uniref:N-acetylglucosaminyldiphosphoundecaprenol N-acetyl-beta-D-mannosaminyltransferase n=1 Tax=Meridianimaribacter flavus TaxID=571115 RepID=A0ABY2G735_9FLAO|nr:MULTISPECIES: WecB/TagA/CpsF family glycosyltransferase [Meridianimaribacter]TBV28272.1 glycosyltransferase [Meridianimaribacter sp. CL38]TDY13595.1 N-acetylglucosaminyldiphosphoundecaprenol N-acetyl-beta-D-mannosaminyltransferase [Meridianimaribacter flavus]
MPKSVKIKEYNIYASDINSLTVEKDKKTIVNTINAHSYIVAKNDSKFKKALVSSDILLPDGEGVVLMAKKLKGEKIKKIAGADIHDYLLDLSEKRGLKCFYLGASQETLDIIKNKQTQKYKNVAFGFYSPPFKPVFSKEDNAQMVSKINAFKPDVLFVGMTAPKQEKWVFDNKESIDANIICSIGAVFDFIAETKKRAPQWVINLKMEWLYRSFTAWRLTKRYLYSTPLFLLEVFKLKYFKKSI